MSILLPLLAYFLNIQDITLKVDLVSFQCMNAFLEVMVCDISA
jgi:hypothetical protein